MAPSNNSNLDDFESSLKDYILSEELEKDFVYLDSSNFKFENYELLKQNYFSKSLLDNKVQIDSRSAILVVNNEEIVEVLNENLTIESVKTLINTYGEL